MVRETRLRSLVKAISYRILGTLATAAIAFAVTGKGSVAFTIGILDFVGKILLFVFHERVWNRLKFGKHELRPVVVWFTGLSGAGKSTLASEVAREMAESGYKVECLDGDAIRHLLPATGFSREQRNEHIKRVGLLASYLQKHGVSVVATFISPYQESRKFVRDLCSDFIEVHVATPFEECERRDPKGLYARARRGEITNFTGISDVYETPDNPELRIDTSVTSVEASSQLIMTQIHKIHKLNSLSFLSMKPKI